MGGGQRAKAWGVCLCRNSFDSAIGLCYTIFCLWGVLGGVRHLNNSRVTEAFVRAKSSLWGHRLDFTEGLILAQDERWRRA